MRVVVADRSGERELAVTVEDERATVGQLLVAAGVEVPDAVTVAGRVIPTGHSLAESAIPDGATIVLGRHPRPRMQHAAASPAHRLSVVAGVSAGQIVHLDRPIIVGRGPGAELRLSSGTVSERHCRVVDDGRGRVTVTDLGSTNGTWVDGEPVSADGGTRVSPGAVIRCGATALRLESTVDDARPRSLDPLRHLTASNTVPFNRPPRPAAPAATPGVLTLPAAPPERRPQRFNAVALLAPLVIGAVMAVAFQNLRLALFMLLSPVMMIANQLGERRRSGGEARRARRDHRAAVERFVADVTTALDAETARRWATVPSIAESGRRGTVPSVRLWERRRTDDDQLVLGAGIGSVPFRPTLVGDGTTRPQETPLVREILDTASRLPDAPVPVDLSRGGVVGIVGDRTAALALARSLVVQAVVHHGPADLALAAVVDPRATGGWSWLPWLPHTAGDGPTAPRLLAADVEDGESVLRGLIATEDQLSEDRRVWRRRAGTPGPGGDADARPDRRTLLLIVDAVAALRGRDAAARAVLRGDAGPVAGIVIAEAEDELPAVCDTVITCGSSDGDARLVRPADRLVVDDLLVAGLDEHDARVVARRLAGLEDPEASAGTARLPARVDLLELLDLVGDGAGECATSATAVAETWASTRGAVSVGTPVGVAHDGTLHLDLSEDGPHGLLGGTTGSGKSELLRSVVAGLAARHDPDHLTFVLVDYKGGAAFDVCADLPHVVGLVTDLDEHLGERALRCLEAELAHRERRLRAAGVSDLPQWLRLPSATRGEPLPRLLVVVDEFATLKAELPTFVDALVGVAQRGRSLGVHMLLGTQRPSGAVDENVRANSNLRIALRVTDRQDSLDVVGVDAAATIPPALPGRGVVRIGPGAVIPVQTALVTGRSRRRAAAAVRVAPLRFGGDGPVVEPGDDEPDGPSDLDRLVEACVTAFGAGGFRSPRRPWPDPLPQHLPWQSHAEATGPTPHSIPIGLVDLPDEQTQRPTSWRLDAGPLLVHGVVGAGTTTTLATAVLAACAVWSPDELHAQVLDMGRSGLAPLAALPHVGAVVSGREDERRRRLLASWFATADARRGMTAAALADEPWLVVVVDGLEALLAELDDPASYETADALTRMIAESAGLRIAPLLSSPRVGGLRTQLTATVEQRLTHRLADPNEYAMLGLRADDLPTMSPGRAISVGERRELQIAHPGDLGDATAAVAARWPAAPVRPAATVAVLPGEVAPGSLVDHVRASSDGAWSLPVGRRERDLDVAGLQLHRGEHGTLLGAPGSGRSGVLGGVAAAAAAADVRVVVCAGSRSSPLLGDGHEVVEPDGLGDLVVEERDPSGLLLVVVDDAERVPDPGPVLEQLREDGPRVHLLVAARTDVVQADYGHWVRRVARSNVGGFLRPVAGTAGDLLGARLPRRTPAAVTAGRGWSVAPGVVDFVQYAVVGEAP